MSEKHFQLLRFTIVAHSCKATFDLEFFSMYYFRVCSVNILTSLSFYGANIRKIKILSNKFAEIQIHYLCFSPQGITIERSSYKIGNNTHRETNKNICNQARE